MALAAPPLLPLLPGSKRISSSRPASQDVCLPRCVEAVPCRGSRNGRPPSPVPASHGVSFIAPSDAHCSLRSQHPAPYDSSQPCLLQACVGQDALASASLLTFPEVVWDEPRASGASSEESREQGGPLAMCRPVGVTCAESVEQPRETNKNLKLQALQAEIDRIERGSPAGFVSAAVLRRRSAARSQIAGPWALDSESTHEIKPTVSDLPVASVAGFAVALAFALRLAAQAQRPGHPGTILICATADILREAGRLYGPGLHKFGLAPERLLIVEAAKIQEALWAMEEGLKSQALSVVIGCLDEVALTPARRLSLAAKAYATPCLFVTDARTPTAGATARRWRVGVKPGEPSSFDASAPGDGCSTVVLEKLRAPSTVSNCVPGAALIGARTGILQVGRFHDLSSRADGQDSGSRPSVTKPVSGDARVFPT